MLVFQQRLLFNVEVLKVPADLFESVFEVFGAKLCRLELLLQGRDLIVLFFDQVLALRCVSVFLSVRLTFEHSARLLLADLATNQR